MNTNEYSIAACKYTRKADGKNASWTFLPGLGRGEGCMGSSNVMAQNSRATLEYEIDLTSECKVAIGILPTQDIYPTRGLRLGVQIDDQPMQKSMHVKVCMMSLVNIRQRILPSLRY